MAEWPKAHGPKGAPWALENSMFHLYILQSLDKNHFYIGVTSSLEERLTKHNRGYAKSTKPFRPWRIIYTENFNSKEGAMRREYYLKSPQGYKEKQLIINKFED